MSADGRKRISKMMKLNIFRFVGNWEVKISGQNTVRYPTTAPRRRFPGKQYVPESSTWTAPTPARSPGTWTEVPPEIEVAIANLNALKSRQKRRLKATFSPHFKPPSDPLQTPFQTL
jgi:hypothetical protein